MMMINKLKNDIDVYLSYSDLLGGNHKLIFLSQSNTNINFLIDAESGKYLFKLNKKSELGLRNQIRYEYDALKTLEKSYVTPRTFFLDDSNTFFEYGVLIMQYIDGRPLEYKNQKDLQESAKIFAKIHSLDIEKNDVSSFVVKENIIEDSLNKSKKNLEGFLKSEFLDIKLKLKINEFLEWGEKNKSCASYFEKDKWNTINNTQANSKKFIVSQKKSKGFLVDWENPIISDPSKDLAYFLSPVTTFADNQYIFTQNERDNFFNTYMMYLDKRDRDIVERVRVYSPYLYLLSISNLVNTLIKLEDKEDIRYKKLKQVINIDFMEKLLKDVF